MGNPTRTILLNLEQARKAERSHERTWILPCGFKYRVTWTVLWLRERTLANSLEDAMKRRKTGGGRPLHAF